MKYSAAVAVAVAVAVAAIVVGSSTACSAELRARSAARSAVRSAAGATPPGDEGRTVANYYRVGDCFRDPIAGATSVALVDCKELHAGEVYAIFLLPDGPFPGYDSSAYEKKCGAAARAYAPDRGDDPTLKTDIRHPDESSWALGDRSVTCIASSNPPRRGSIHQ